MRANGNAAPGPESRGLHGVSRGVVVNGNGHRFQQILLGPYAGYDFGPISLNARILQSVHAENGFNTSQYHLGASFAF